MRQWQAWIVFGVAPILLITIMTLVLLVAHLPVTSSPVGGY